MIEAKQEDTPQSPRALTDVISGSQPTTQHNLTAEGPAQGSGSSAHHLVLRTGRNSQSHDSPILTIETRNWVANDPADFPTLPVISYSDCLSDYPDMEEDMQDTLFWPDEADITSNHDEFASLNPERRQKLHDILQAALDLVD